MDQKKVAQLPPFSTTLAVPDPGDAASTTLELDELRSFVLKKVNQVRVWIARVLCMGWYIYESANQTSTIVSASDSVEISGHDVAALVVWKGTREFEALNKTFSNLEENYRGSSKEVQI